METPKIGRIRTHGSNLFSSFVILDKIKTRSIKRTFYESMGTREEFLFNYFFFFFDEKQQGNILNKDLKSTKEG